MQKRIPSRLVAILLLVLLFASSVAGAPVSGPPSPAASGRASDTEPNDYQSQAVALSSGEVVDGTLMLNPTNDYYDYYKISVPYGKVLNASLFLVDYDYSNPGKYDFSLYLYAAGSYWWLDNSSTKNRWESVLGIQSSNPAGEAMMFIAVAFGSNYQGGRYSLSAYISDAPVYSGGNATGTLDRSGPASRAAYRLDPGPADDRRTLATLKTPATGNFSVHLYNIWPVDRSWNLRNESWLNVAGNTQTAVVNGCGGTWYAIIKAMAGNGSYTFSLEELGGALDDNNFPEKAVAIDDDSAHLDYIDQGTDWVDWWKVEVRAGKPIMSAYCSLVAGTYDNWSSLNLSAYDKDLKYIKGATFPYYSSPYADLQNITMGYNGTVYFAMRALSRYLWGVPNFISASAWYKLTVTQANDAPVLNGALPAVHMMEDQSDDSLVLSEFVSDPDNDTLSFNIIGSNYNTRPRINATTGRVNLTPVANWHGSEMVRFRAQDDGPGRKTLELNTTVTVEPVNDAPVAAGTIEDIILAEDAPAGATPDIASLFRDVDDPVGNLSYSLRQVAGDTHPPNAVLPRQYDEGSRTYRLGPARGFFGNFTMAVECTDRQPGTVPAVVRFNLTIVHKNHAPALSLGVKDPMTIVVREGRNNTDIVVSDLFSDVDCAADYAGDTLTYSITNGSKLAVAILESGRLRVDTGKEQYYPGVAYSEKFLITAKDRAGLKATVNLTVMIEPVDDRMVIVDFQPEELDPSIPEGKKEVFRVTALDPEEAPLSYTWYIDGVRDRTQAGPSYQFQPDFRMGGAVHRLKVVVSAGEDNATVEWAVTVVDVNRLPTGAISQPTNFTKFRKGEFITFIAEARDEDGDNLTLSWRDGAGKLLGTGTTMSTDKLEAGTQTVRLEISDGKGSVYIDVVVAIAKPSPAPSKGFIPGFAALAVVSAALSALVLGLRRRRDPG
jgi:hypothetical protein